MDGSQIKTFTLIVVLVPCTLLASRIRLKPEARRISGFEGENKSFSTNFSQARISENENSPGSTP